MRVLFKKIDTYFLVVLAIGIFLRFLSFLFTPITDDTVSYIESAKFMININYESLRPPVFPFLIVPFLLLTGDGALSAKIVSLIISILLILSSYFVFTEASLKIFKKHNDVEKKAKKIGLIACLLIIFNIYFITHSGKGLREELIALICILLFYFIIIKKMMSLKDNISLAVLTCLLTLTQLSTGFFTIIGIIIFCILSRFKRFKFKSISSVKLLIILISFVVSFLLWSIFSAFKWGDPFSNWNTQGAWFGIKYGVDLSSFQGMVNAGLNALTFGLPSIFIYLFVLFGGTFTILILFFIFNNLRNKEILFIFLIVGLNYAYLTIYITTPRVIMYYFYILVFIGAIPLSIIFVQLETQTKEMQKKMKYYLIVFIITYIIRGLDTLSIIYLIYQIYNFIPHFSDLNTIISIFYQPLNPIILIINVVVIIINEGSLLIYLIKGKKMINFKIENEIEKVEKQN